MLNHKITRSKRRPGLKPDNLSLLRPLFLALLILPLGATAGVYKWVDAEGNVHYGSQRPENTKAEKLKIETSKSPYLQDSAAKDKTTKKDETTREEPAKKEAETAKPETPKEPQLSRKEKKRLCTSARQRLAKIESRGRLKTTDEKGNTRHLTDDERSGRLKEARADVAKYCR